MSRQLDVLFVNAGSTAQAYPDVGKTNSVSEPPTWELLPAQSCRAKGSGVAILDCMGDRRLEAARRKNVEVLAKLKLCHKLRCDPPPAPAQRN
jgi:hypothetical protein